MMSTLAAVPASTHSPSRSELLDHAIYTSVNSIRDLQVFMREHVFAVWDFMSLLKRLQSEVASPRVPWMESHDAESVRLVNEIVLGEESDEDGHGGYTSHFNLYRQAMLDVGADTHPIDTFIESVRAGSSIDESLSGIAILDSTKDFVRANLELASHGTTHEVAAAFCFGREDIIPDMFERLLPTLSTELEELARFRYYLERHIEVDGDQHGPMARRLVRQLCDGNKQFEAEALAAADTAVRRRIALWDGVLTAIRSNAN